MTVTCFFWRLREAAGRIEQAGIGYVVALVAGAAIGSYGAGTANLWLSGETGVARSIVGGLAGGIASIELYKRARGISGSTGIIFVPAFCTTVAIGRWGCFYSGLTDHTHGCPASLPWAHDFGDGVPRHPVQLYESAAMAAFLVYALVMLARRNAFFMRNGFYLMVLWYAAQRFCWEFLKPYAPVLGPLNLFHLICLALIAYALAMLIGSQTQPRAPADTPRADKIPIPNPRSPPMVRTPSTMLPLGTTAPDFDLPNVDGRMVDYAAAAGPKGTVVMFICNHCPFVKHVADQLATLGREYLPRGVGFAAISSNDVSAHPADSPEQMVREAEDRGYVFPYLYDETQEVAKAYHAACTPDFYVFDADRKLVYRGQLDPSRPGSDVPVSGHDLRVALDTLLAGKSPVAAQIPSLGCNIKWKPGNHPPYFSP